MGFLMKRFWDVVLVAALLAVLGGAAIMQAAMGTGGNAFGQGISGAFTFVKSIATGFQDADAVSPDKLPPAKPAPTKGSGSASSTARVN